MRFSHIVGGYEVPPNIKKCLEEQPARSGMYNWIFAHKGEINTYAGIIDRLDEYDQVQINMSPRDMVWIPEIRRRLKGSSTKLIINNDYVCEYWGKWGIDPFNYDAIQRMGDMVFSTEPNQVSNMIDGTFVIPHPTNTKILKRLGTAYDNDSVGYIYHWWAPENMYLGSRTLRKLKQQFGWKKNRIYGWNPRNDKMAQHVEVMFDDIADLQQFPDFAQQIQGERLVYDPNPYHTYGRNGVELACFKKPVVGSNRVFSYQKLFPGLTISPMDFNDTKKKFELVFKDKEKINQMVEDAYEKVEYFNYKNSVKRWNEACDIAFDRGGTTWYQKQM